MLQYSFRRILLSLCSIALMLISLEFWKTTWRPPLKSPKSLTYHNGSGILTNLILSENCQRLIQDYIHVPVPALLIDRLILAHLEHNKCERMSLEGPIKVAVDENYSTGRLSSKFLEAVSFKNETNNDYLEFGTGTEMKTIIPKNFRYQIVGNLMIPTQIPLFLEFWNRGRFVECRNFPMHRDSTKTNHFTPLMNFWFPPRKPIPASESVGNLARLRDEMLQFGIFPFLNGGTVLGWYRECSVIPHTTDMDIAIMAENWNVEYSDFLWTHNSSFRVKRQLGLVNDSYELTLIPKTGFETPIDVFLMYKENASRNNDRWVGGLTTTGIKYKYIYPDYDPWCAADLMGHLFWVTCTPEEKIKNEYGDYWYLDENSSKYTWNKARNAVENGRFTWKQMQTETYNEYKLSFLP